MQFTHYELLNASIEESISCEWKNISNYTAESLKDIACEHLVNFGVRKVEIE